MEKRLTKLLLLRALCFSVLFFLVATVQAEIQYVGDTLRVGVRAQPDHSLPSFAVIVTGDSVEVLEKQHDFLRIRTQAGLEGWVKSSYLSTHKPASIVLDEMRKRQQAMQAELNRLRAESTSFQDGGKAIVAAQIKLDELTKENQQLRELSDTGTAGQGWVYWLGGILVMALLGFLSGLLWSRHRIMKKLGGLTL